MNWLYAFLEMQELFSSPKHEKKVLIYLRDTDMYVLHIVQLQRFNNFILFIYVGVSEVILFTSLLARLNEQ